MRRDADLVEEGDCLVEGGYQATLRLLDRAPDLTAVFAQNDLMGIGALSALDDRGLRVPEDCSVVGCDDLPITARTIPPLTTVSVPFHEAGEVAIRLLLETIAGASAHTSAEPLPVHLVRRASSGRLDGRATT